MYPLIELTHDNAEDLLCAAVDGKGMDDLYWTEDHLWVDTYPANLNYEWWLSVAAFVLATR
jgi:hypothetical protein